MKKNLITTLIVSMAVCSLTACGSAELENVAPVTDINSSVSENDTDNTSEDNQKNNEIKDFSEPEIIDYSQMADLITYIPETPEEFKGKNVIETYSELCYDITMNINDISGTSDGLLTAKVNGFSYTALGDSEYGKMPWTIIHATVLENVSGNINAEAGEDIDIYTFGGYISMRDSLGDILYQTGGKYGDESNKPSEEEIDNTIYHENFDSSELPIIGQEYAFYITTREDGIYELTCGQYGALLKCDDTFIRKAVNYGECEEQAEINTLNNDNNDVKIEAYSLEELNGLLN